MGGAVPSFPHTSLWRALELNLDIINHTAQQNWTFECLLHDTCTSKAWQTRNAATCNTQPGNFSPAFITTRTHARVLNWVLLHNSWLYYATQRTAEAACRYRQHKNLNCNEGHGNRASKAFRDVWIVVKTGSWYSNVIRSARGTVWLAETTRGCKHESRQQ